MGSHSAEHRRMYVHPRSGTCFPANLWAGLLRITQSALYNRIQKWSLEKALDAPNQIIAENPTWRHPDDKRHPEYARLQGLSAYYRIAYDAQQTGEDFDQEAAAKHSREFEKEMRRIQRVLEADPVLSYLLSIMPFEEARRLLCLEMIRERERRAEREKELAA